jgi:hypothetical protein
MEYIQTISPKEWVKKYVDFDILISAIKGSLNDAIRFENIVDGQYEAYVYDVVSGSYGHYQWKAILKYFDYEIKEDFEGDEWVYEEIQSFSSEVASYINEELEQRGLNGRVYFGNLESDGSYGLFYIIDKDMVDEENV